MIQDLSGGQAIEVMQAKEHFEYFDLRWSPPSTEILVAGEVAGRHGLWVVPRLGGRSREITGTSGHVAWSPDGSRMARTPVPRARIDVYDLSGANADSISLKGAYKWVHGIDWSQSHWMLLTTQNEQERSALWAVGLGSKEEFQLLEDPVAELASARWAPSGDAIYYLRASGRTAALWKLRVDPQTAKPIGAPSLLVGGLPPGRRLSISKDAKRLVYARELDSSNLWLMSRDRNVGEEGKVTTVQLTSGTQIDAWPSVSPDGQRIAFSRQGREGANIFVMPTEGGPTRQLTSHRAFDLATAWSPDGKEIAFGSNEVGIARVWKVDAEGGVPRVFAQSRMGWDVSGPRSGDVTWSPGKQILYQVPGNTNFRFLDPVSDKEKPLLEKEDGWIFGARFAPDACKVAALWVPLAGRGRGCYVMDACRGAEPLLLANRDLQARGRHLFVPLAWSLDQMWIYGLTGSEDALFTAVEMASSKGSPSRLYMQLPFRVDSAAMTSDGRLVATVPQTQSDVWLMENFDPDVP